MRNYVFVIDRARVLYWLDQQSRSASGRRA